MTTVVLQAAMADYRQRFVELVGESASDCTFLVGDVYFDPSIRTAVDGPCVRVAGRNTFIAGRRLLWQRGVVWTAIRADVAVVELNPRILSSWWVLAARRAMKRPVAAWGHAWPRNGRDTRTETVRSLMRRLAGTVFLYGYEQARELDELQPGIRSFVVPNAIYSLADIVPVDGPARDVVYVGRLVAEKRVDLLLEAFAATGCLGGDARLFVVGDGPERVALEQLAERLGIRRAVTFTGHVADVSTLRKYYSEALCAAIPGTVGLGATQALGWGVPVVWPDAGAHGPEVEQLEVENSASFSAGSIESLAATLFRLKQDAPRIVERRARVSAALGRRFSAEAMATRFVEALGELQ